MEGLKSCITQYCGCIIREFLTRNQITKIVLYSHSCQISKCHISNDRLQALTFFIKINQTVKTIQTKGQQRNHFLPHSFYILYKIFNFCRRDFLFEMKILQLTIILLHKLLCPQNFTRFCVCGCVNNIILLHQEINRGKFHIQQRKISF